MKKIVSFLLATFYLHSVEIVPIQESDATQVYSQLLELVQFEGSAPYFLMTFERMQQELFGPSASWNCLVGKEGDEVVAFCLYSFVNPNRAFNLSPALHIDDLFVKAEYRRLNIGHNLLRELALIAQSRGIDRFVVWCMKENEVGQAFYHKFNAQTNDLADCYRIKVDQFLSEANSN